MWQDWVIAGCSAAFSWALVPQVVRGFRDRRGYVEGSTAGVTTGGLCLTAFALLTLGLWLSGTLSIITGSLWLMLWGQRIVYGGPTGSGQRQQTIVVCGQWSTTTGTWVNGKGTDGR